VYFRISFNKYLENTRGGNQLQGFPTPHVASVMMSNTFTKTEHINNS